MSTFVLGTCRVNLLRHPTLEPVVYRYGTSDEEYEPGFVGFVSGIPFMFQILHMLAYQVYPTHRHPHYRGKFFPLFEPGQFKRGCDAFRRSKRVIIEISSIKSHQYNLTLLGNYERIYLPPYMDVNMDVNTIKLTRNEVVYYTSHIEHFLNMLGKSVLFVGPLNVVNLEPRTMIMSILDQCCTHVLDPTLVIDINKDLYLADYDHYTKEGALMISAAISKKIDAMPLEFGSVS
jgi:hypothetical protein